MPVTRSTRRAVTRTNTKRTILSALDENKPATIEELKLQSPSSSSYHGHDLPDLNVLQPESIQVILSDIQNQIKVKQESLSIRGVEIAKKQQEEFFVGTMKLDKKVKKMTIREFNLKHMTKPDGNGNDSSSGCILEALKAMMLNSAPYTSNSTSDITNTNGNGNDSSSSAARLIKSNLKRGAMAMTMELETPVRQLKPGKACRTPGTILRTVRKGEHIYSSNGSPVQETEEGDLVATVSKKRRGNQQGGNGTGDAGGDDAAAMFDINIDGRTISLSDKSTMEHLTNDMKNTAKNQLNVLQDQLAKLLSHLGS